MRLRISSKDTFINDNLFMMSSRLFVFNDDIFRLSNSENFLSVKIKNIRLTEISTYNSAGAARSTITGRSFVSSYGNHFS